MASEKRRDGLRLETDSMGAVEVPIERYWGVQTQRSLDHFSIGDEPMPIELIHSLVLVKKAAAMANRGVGVPRPSSPTS